MGGYVTGGGGEDFSIGISLSTENVLVAEQFDSTVGNLLDRKDTELGFMGTFMGLLGTYGVVKQYDLLERQTDLNERMVDYAERYLTLAENNYTDITLNAYNRQTALYDRFLTDFAPFELEFLNEAKSKLDYTPDYAGQAGRATAGIGQQFTTMRQRRARQRSKYATGACCHEDLMIDVMQASALADAMNRGYRYEDDRKLRLDEWYWQHYSQAIQLVENMRANVITGINSGVANATGAVSAITGMLSQMSSATRGLSDAISDQASFFGTLSNGAFRMMGFNWGRHSVAGGYGGITRGGFDPLASIGNTAASSLAVAPSGGISTGYNNVNSRLGGFMNNVLGII